MNTLKIGWSRRSINIDGPVILPGQMYLRISEGIMDPLYSTVLCIEDGNDVAIFCTCDLGGIRYNILPLTRQRVRQLRPEIPVDKIIMGATHTHTGVGLDDSPETTPDGQPIYPGAKAREFFVAQTAEAIIEAWDTRAEGGFAYGYGYATVGHSRRVVYHDDYSLRSKANAVAPNGHGVMYGRTNDDQFSHYEAGSDSFLNAMFTFDKEQKLTGIVVNVPCPSQLSEHFRVQTADFWAEVRQLIAKEYGEEVFLLPQCAAAGDLSPRTLHYNYATARRFRLKYDMVTDPFDYDNKSPEGYNKILCERMDIAQRITDGIREVYSWAKKDVQTQAPVRHKVETLQLPKRRITDAEKQWCEDTIKLMDQQLEAKKHGDPETVRKAVSRHQSICNRNKLAVHRWEIQDADPNLPMECHTVRIGDIAFATNRFELYMDFMHRIQARSPFTQTFVIQLAGDEGGSYLPTERGVANKGYSASIFCNQVGPEGGQVLVDETLRMLRSLRD